MLGFRSMQIGDGLVALDEQRQRRNIYELACVGVLKKCELPRKYLAHLALLKNQHRYPFVAGSWKVN
jgi:hypothetical protein